MWKCASRSLRAIFRKGVLKYNTVLSTKTLEKKELNCLLKFTPALIERCNSFYNYYKRTSEIFKGKHGKEGPKEKSSFVGVDSDFICALKLGGLFALFYCFVENKFKFGNPSLNVYENQLLHNKYGHYKTLGYFIDSIGIKPYNYVLPGVEAAKLKNDTQPASEFPSNILKSDEIDLNGLEVAHQKVLGSLTNWLGTQCTQSGRHEEALQYFKQSAEEDHAPGIFNLGICYERGLGTCQNFKRAEELYQRAADLGHATAMYNLGVFYAQGKGGIQPDLNHARELFKAAAKLGQANAIQALNLEQQNTEKQTGSDFITDLKESTFGQIIFHKLLNQSSSNPIRDFGSHKNDIRDNDDENENDNDEIRTSYGNFEYPEKEINSLLEHSSGILELSPHSEPCLFVI